jgi:hypothetical protein
MRLLRNLKNLLGRADAQPVKQPPATSMEHPVLGSLSPHKMFPESLSGRLKYGPNQIDLLVSPDYKGIEVALELAVALAESLQHLDLKCKSLIADESLGGYNSGWRFGEVAQLDGTLKSFEKPFLTREEFCNNLKLESIEASGDSMLIFWYGDGDMFWGHSLEVTSFDGVAFKDTYVSMAG